MTSSRGSHNAHVLFSSLDSQRAKEEDYPSSWLPTTKPPSRSEVPTDKSLELRSIVVADCRRTKSAGTTDRAGADLPWDKGRTFVPLTRGR